MTTDQYPPLPKGYSRWEPRPRGWKSEGTVKYAFLNHRLPNPRWQEMPGTMRTFGDPQCDYVEAVREPAKTEPEQLHAPGDPSEWMPQETPPAPVPEPGPRNPTDKELKLLALLHRARRHSDRMDMVAYSAIQDAINLLTE